MNIKNKCSLITILMVLIWPSISAWGQKSYEHLEFDILETGTLLHIEGKIDSCFVLPDSVPSYRRMYPVKSLVGTFYKMLELKSIELPGILEEIGSKTFRGCENLSHIRIPSSVREIGENAFASANLQYAEVEPGNTHYDSRENCHAIIETSTNTLLVGSNTATIPSSVTSIASTAFMGKKALKTICLPSSVKSIGESAFEDCSELTTFVFNDSVESIESHAFLRCAKLEDVHLPLTLRKIKGRAFEGCIALKHITIPASVNEIQLMPFGGCSELETIEVDKDNKYYDSRNGCNAIIEKETCLLLAASKNATIPSGVKRIGPLAFKGIAGIRNVIIPKKVDYIGYLAFSDCKDLESITLPRKLKMMGDRAFWGCDNLKYIVIHRRRPPESDLYDKDESSIRNLKNAVLYVPKGCVQRYQQSEGWNMFGEIREIKELKKTHKSASKKK